MTAFCWKGFKLPARTASLKVRPSKMTEREQELVGQFLAPLLPQVGRNDDQDATLPLRPALGDQEPGLDGLSQAHLVGQDGTTGKRVPEGEQSRLDLMGIQVDLGIRENRRQLLDAVEAPPPRQFMGDVLGVVRRSGRWDSFQVFRQLVHRQIFLASAGGMANSPSVGGNYRGMKPNSIIGVCKLLSTHSGWRELPALGEGITQRDAVGARRSGIA